VSCLDEALELRRGGVTMPILILGHTPAEYTGELIENNITQAVTCEAKAVEYSKVACACGKNLKIHIKLDTGMSRLGFLCTGRHFEEGADGVVRSCKMKNLTAEGIFTHFAVSDEPGADNREYTLEQFRTFTGIIDECEKRGVGFAIRHCANSGAVVNYPEMALDMVRPGLTLYGYGDEGGRLNLLPAMRLVTTISTIKIYDPGTDVSYGRKFRTARQTRMGVLGIGYADGLPRAASNKCSFWTRGGLAPQRGAICMDMCMIDLTDLPETAVGDEVEIFGEHADINTLASAAGTISYELMCSVSKRVPRIYKG
jgi:alanine racemase